MVTIFPTSEGWKRRKPILTQPVMPLAELARPGILGESMSATSMTSSQVE